ncbi:tRNA/rRNA methyltransferase [Biostraticola tofi]|uniref:TrmH RNA methyltransferase n=1 Tax=Biostraticola tofi TaxID=466109 RepID=A0A4R3YLB6_9GAMM|nr:tRNA/rRNA methyltransferase [Biostraticola tofi]TCV93066.1 TrmH RNA methyltransferase [Biostraticola tofi]
MSDSLKGKGGKVRVMYVRKDEEEAPRRSSRSDAQPGRDSGGRRGENPRRGEGRPARNERPGIDDRKHSAPRRDKPAELSDSPWKTSWQSPDKPAVPDHGGISGQSQIDPEQLRRQRAEETRVYGENACKALFKNRPDSIVRAWFVQSVTPRFRDALRFMAANRKAYHVVDDEELAKASGTDHHGGVCFLIKKRLGLDAIGYLDKSLDKDCVLALEDVSNPHNLGAILRSSAHFGVNGVMVNDAAVLESGAAVRTAEGGAEHITAIQSDDFLNDLSRFSDAGYTIVTTSSHKGTPLASVIMPRKMVLVLGQEREGLSDEIQRRADVAISIGGTGKVESLNVSVAAGILLAEWWRQNQ